MSNEIINKPGKFEGEREHALYFHELVQNGGGDVYFDENDTCYDVFYLDDSDRKRFDLSDIDFAVIYYTDDNGFVYCPIVDEDELNTFIEDIESD